MTAAPVARDNTRPAADESAAGRLELRNVTKTFTGPRATVTAAEDVNLVVEPGEFITLLGPSGCGKTTTLRIVAGFETATAGRVLLDGALIDHLPPQQREMAMVFQSYALFPHLTVAQNIAYGLKLQRRSKEEIANAMKIAMASMNLVGLENRSPHELSGGQQQRVALARALVIRPKVLLFDEPLSNLDAKLRAAMRSEIRRIQRMLAITSLYVTHDQDEAMSLSDRVVVMNKGRVEQVATPAEIYLRPASVFVADFIGRANFIEVPVHRLAAGRATVTALGQQLAVEASEALDQHESAALLMVRPETLAVRAAPDSGMGVVLTATFHGDSAEYEVETSSGTLTVIEAGPDPRRIFPEGTNVAITIDPERAYVLRRE
jgi:ABC-type Fe3+/spermidine/putrescine transport system ATPase subunit